ncbi:hypothetical protein MRX96_058361 [Rhipicephalus microplus]
MSPCTEKQPGHVALPPLPPQFRRFSAPSRVSGSPRCLTFRSQPRARTDPSSGRCGTFGGNGSKAPREEEGGMLELPERTRRLSGNVKLGGIGRSSYKPLVRERTRCTRLYAARREDLQSSPV